MKENWGNTLRDIANVIISPEILLVTRYIISVPLQRVLLSPPTLLVHTMGFLKPCYPTSCHLLFFSLFFFKTDLILLHRLLKQWQTKACFTNWNAVGWTLGVLHWPFYYIYWFVLFSLDLRNENDNTKEQFWFTVTIISQWELLSTPTIFYQCLLGSFGRAVKRLNVWLQHRCLERRIFLFLSPWPFFHSWFEN